MLLKKEMDFEEEYLSEKLHNYEEKVHFTMSLIGGVIACYTIILLGSLGAAQTSSLIQLFISFFELNMLDVVIRALTFSGFILALALAYHQMKKNKTRAQKQCIIVEIGLIFCIGFISQRLSGVGVLLPVTLLGAFQYVVFNGTNENECATVFCTGNIKKCTCLWVDYNDSKEAKYKKVAIFYTKSLTFYFIGAVASGIAFYYFSYRSIWLCIVPLILAYADLKVPQLLVRQTSVKTVKSL